MNHQLRRNLPRRRPIPLPRCSTSAPVSARPLLEASFSNGTTFRQLRELGILWPHCLSSAAMFRSPLLCAFDASGRYFVSVTADNRLKLWDVATGNLLQHFQDRQSPHSQLHRHRILPRCTQHLRTVTKESHPQPLPQPSLRPPSAMSHSVVGAALSVSSTSPLETSAAVSSTTGQSSHLLQSSLSLSTSSNTQLLSSDADGALHTHSFPSLTLLSTATCPDVRPAAAPAASLPMTSCWLPWARR